MLVWQVRDLSLHMQNQGLHIIVRVLAVVVRTVTLLHMNRLLIVKLCYFLKQFLCYFWLWVYIMICSHTHTYRLARSFSA